MAKRRKRARQVIQLRVTLAGWLFLLMSLLVGLAAVRSTMPMMFIVFGVMLGVVLISSVLSRGMIRAVAVHRELPPRAWQCETLNVGYFIRNRRKRGSCLGLRLEEVKPQGIEDARGYCVHLPPQTVFRAGSRLAVYRRGRIRLSAIRVSTQFPFGLLDVNQRIQQPTSLVVWPAKGRLQSDLLLHGASQSSNAPPSRTQGGQDEFFGLREYRQGDNPRWIHWRRSAGRSVPVVREMAHPVPDAVFLVLETRMSGADELAAMHRETRLQFAATLIEHALHRGYLVGLAMAGNDVPLVFTPATGRGSRCDMLDALADVNGSTQVDLDTVIEALPPRTLQNAQTLVVAERPGDISIRCMENLVRASRSLRVVGPNALDEIFEPNPLTSGEEGAA
ncbi:MAG: DUF58 domain-containing protein [Bacteroidetes bacterium]|jgi:uncharacterized protein (DUF58 family)|nr:DUF58 domain-containing protein [Phycisphaerae bacterium]NBC17146.1 DUF58 domain-containing protein [Bacteroidota bacterium]